MFLEERFRELFGCSLKRTQTTQPLRLSLGARANVGLVGHSSVASGGADTGTRHQERLLRRLCVVARELDPVHERWVIAQNCLTHLSPLQDTQETTARVWRAETFARATLVEIRKFLGRCAGLWTPPGPAVPMGMDPGIRLPTWRRLILTGL